MVNTRAESRKQGEPVISGTMEDRVRNVEEEVIRMKAIMEELCLQASQNHSTLEEMRKEAAENQTKMMELMTRSFEKKKLMKRVKVRWETKKQSLRKTPRVE
ncbi:hypothetical protein V8G54_007418 [Vigna mungo]|uniref:Uncharacterized protein n=1 Tax=Vigna mungo TaxID=3915 RepID=A0AAQ3P109_VIGMU